MPQIIANCAALNLEFDTTPNTIEHEPVACGVVGKVGHDLNAIIKRRFRIRLQCPSPLLCYLH